MPSTLEILTAVRDALRALPLDPELDPEGEKLFEAVELAANKALAKQLNELLVMKSRAGLLVPLRIARTVRTAGVMTTLPLKYLELAFIYTDKAYFKASQAVTFGSAQNLGLFAFDERIEAELTGKELSPFGAIVPGDSDPLLLSESEAKDAPGREAWLMQLFVPVGMIVSDTL